MSWLASVRLLPIARELGVNEPEIVRAIDLGGVQVLKHGDLFLLSDGFGDVRPDSRGLGLYTGDTRILSCLSLTVNGSRPILLSSGSGGNYRGTIQMTNADIPASAETDGATAPVSLARRSLGISRERTISDSLHERVSVTNFTLKRERAVVELSLNSDDADIFEVRGQTRPMRGSHLPVLVRDDGRVTFRYEGLDGFVRWTFVETARPAAILPSAGEGADGTVAMRWEHDLAAGGEFAVDWWVWTALTPSRRHAPGGRATLPAANANRRRDSILAQAFAARPTRERVPEEEYGDWARDSAEVSSDNELFDLVIARSLADLRLLTTEGPNPGERYVAAGVPWYATLFGRDLLITGLETLAFRPAIAVEALQVLAARQAVDVDDWRDAQPGKILHELRTGEMARAGEVPFAPYYGTVDATPLWLMLLGSVYDWTGDRDLVDSLWPNAMAALRWIDDYGVGADGFIDYECRSSVGLVNQGWKDSSDGIIDRSGAILEPPIALAEAQGYVYSAKQSMARLADMRGNASLARRLEAEAEDLRARFEKAFWLPDRHYYAMALGKDGRRADAIGSNPGQCLWAGIIAEEHAANVAARLMARDLDSGWGIRTLAAAQPGYNPIGYHTGTVWPHDNALIIAGLKRYGFHAQANALAGKIFEAAQRFDDYRLPELFCGFDRTAFDPPVPYPVACSPQAWAAAAPLHFLSSLLGFSANAERRELELRQPQLPAWLTRVTIKNLRVGQGCVDLLFRNSDGMTSAEVLRKDGDLAITVRI